ncbi:helix-turn-helix transcriptional regulator [Streptomyces sp. WMMC500]|uniref:helix-turn-helix domain-containing protein n=1 Tax=Streptomyces sp. WMMC500 TaxID=3015154 RepID=UPI00248CE40C|nr:helix-turn-helix transcriptional regulator [Streptomyces sp. WMMC500]WBB60220.1 helix-turn-helix transcriptional regulator [Streptomyces sp. WMMC500]
MRDAATEKFAALLRELKQRSGRSYGSLAARLHVSTSTLHRYCNGDAVPSSYAPAERFARLCGATPDELVELHRRWHRAHGIRRGAAPSWAAGEEPRGGGRGRDARSPKRGTPAAGAGRAGASGRRPAVPDGPRGHDPAAGADGEPTADVSTDTRSPAAAVPGAADSVPRGAAAREGRGGGASASDGTGGSVDKSAPDDAPAAGGAGDSGSGDTPSSGAAVPRAARGHRWSRLSLSLRGAAAGGFRAAGLRGRWVGLPVAGVVAVALVAFVAISSGSTGEGRAGGGDGRESGVVADGSRGGGGAKGGETAEKDRAADPSGRRKPSPAGGGAGEDHPEDGASPRKGGAAPPTGRDEGSVQTPLAWSVRSHVWENGCDHRYVLDKSPDDVPPPPVAQDAEAWAASQGAVHGGTTNIETAIEPRGAEPVTVTAVHVRKSTTGAPLPWTAFAMSDGCGGEVTKAAYTVDLDTPRPVLKPMQGGDSTQTWDPPALPYRVTPDDPLSLLVYANTEDHDVRWYLEVEWSTGDDSGVIRIDDRGAPFRTSAIQDRPLYGYDYANGFWRSWPLADDPDAQDPASSAPPAP